MQQRLAETDQKLAQLQQSQDPGQLTELTTEQRDAIQAFLDEKLAIRKQLRDVRYQLNADIDELGSRLKWLNTAAVPALLTLGVLFWWLLGRARRKR